MTASNTVARPSFYKPLLFLPLLLYMLNIARVGIVKRSFSTTSKTMAGPPPPVPLVLCGKNPSLATSFVDALNNTEYDGMLSISPTALSRYLHKGSPIILPRNIKTSEHQAIRSIIQPPSYPLFSKNFSSTIIPS